MTDSIVRPPEPCNESVWYRGWEVGYNELAGSWIKEGWEAYKGGVDLDAPYVSATTYSGVLDEIDAEEDE